MKSTRFPNGPISDLGTGYVTLEWSQWFQNPQIVSIDIATPLDVESGGTGLTEGTSGGVLAFTDETTISSSDELIAHALVLGGGAGDVPATPVDLGTTTTVLHGNASGDPTWSKVDLANDVTGTLSVPHGGTGDTILTVHGVLIGNDLNPITASAAMSDGQLLVGQTSADPLPKTMSGDATMTAAGALTLANTTVTAGAYGDATHVGTFTVDTKGRLTAAANVAISGVPPGGGQATTTLSTPINPTGTNSLVGLMMGLNQSITPQVTGRVWVTITGSIANSTSGDGSTVQIRMGTGSAPTNGAALTGTAYGPLQADSSVTNSLKHPFSVTALVTGLTVGTAYWIDMSVAAVTGGTSTATSVAVSAFEL